MLKKELIHIKICLKRCCSRLSTLPFSMLLKAPFKLHEYKSEIIKSHINKQRTLYSSATLISPSRYEYAYLITDNPMPN